MRAISLKELKEHKTWIAIEGNVYDVSDFLDSHPGGPEVMSDVLGADGNLKRFLCVCVFVCLFVCLFVFFFLKKKFLEKQRLLLLAIMLIPRLLAICCLGCRWGCWRGRPEATPPLPALARPPPPTVSRHVPSASSIPPSHTPFRSATWATCISNGSTSQFTSRYTAFCFSIPPLSF